MANTLAAEQLADAVHAALRNNDLAGGTASYETWTATYFYSYTGDGGTLILGTAEDDRYLLAYADEPTLDEAISYLGTATDDEAGTRFYDTAGAAVAAYATARKDHA